MTIQIQTIASSSAGNCYKISEGESSLLIEAGIPIARIKKALDFKLHEVDGCLVSHWHGDHSQAVPALLKAGVDCYMSTETAESFGMDICTLNRVNILKPRQQLPIHGWLILPFETVHDVPGSLGFLVQGPSGDKLLFATDTAYIRPRFKGLNYIMCECNYSEQALEDSLKNGSITLSQYQRVMETHFGLKNVVEFLKANDLSRVREVHLLHLSDGNSDEDLIVSTIQRLTGLPVFAAKA